MGIQAPTLVDKDQFYVKIDHNIASNHRLSFAYERVIPWFIGELSGKSGHSYISGTNGWLSPEIGNGFIDDRDSHRLRFNYVWTASPHVLASFRAGVTRNPKRLISKYPFYGSSSTYGRDAGLNGTLSPTTPQVSMQGVSGFGPIFDQILVASQKTPFTADVNWSKGSHNLKLGADFIALPFVQINDFNSMGTFSFTDRITGQPGRTSTGSGYASFLLGEVDNGSVTSPVDQRAYSGGWGFYAQDQWRVNSRLTLNYGLRWNLFIPMSELQTKISSFDPNLPNPGAGGRLGALSIYGNGPGRNGLTSVADYYYKAFGPHLGFAYRVDGKTVVRASYGISYAPAWQKWYGSTGSTQPTAGFSAQRTVTSLDNGITPGFNWNGGFPLTFPQFPVIDPALQNGSSLGFIDRHENRPAMSQNLNFEVGRELPKQISVRVAYVGNLSHRLPSSGAVDLNAIPLSALRLGSLLTANVRSPEAQAAGIAIPYPTFQGSVAQALRPYPQFTGIPVLGAQIGASTYHALQINVQKRVGGLTFLAAYTLSKQLTNVNFPGFNGTGGTVTQHPDLRQYSKELLNKDRPQMLALSWAYELPFGPGKRFFTDAHGAAKYAVGGWRLSGIQNYMSGEPFRVSSRSTIPGGFSGIWPLYVPGQQVAATGCSAYNPSDPSRNRYININAFATPAPFTLGNISQIKTLRNCAYKDEAFQLEKEFAIREHTRIHLGTMVLNLFNRHIWSGLQTDINNPDSFGRFSSVYSPRNVQLFLKIEF